MKSITIKNIPDEIYLRLKASAARNRRSLNQEVLAILDAPRRKSPQEIDEMLARADELRKLYLGPPTTIDEIQAAIDEGHE